jgi:predicted NAD-dependent protein-ADP-ribosyltransferase YbiA (DUF1768 family)
MYNTKENQLILTTPFEQPYGVLSNLAVVDFNVDMRILPGFRYSFKRGPWKTVSQYVYVNMFKNEKYRQEMSQNLAPNPFDTMLDLRKKDDIDIYDQAIKTGLQARFRQNEALRNRLYQTRGKQLVYNNKDVLLLLNNLRAPSVQWVYDPKTRKDVPRDSVLEVIMGVHEEVSKNHSLSNDLSFEDLKKYAKSGAASAGAKIYPIDHEIFMNINHIVPIVKHKIFSRLLEQEIAKFKTHLLDVYLDSILEKYYKLHPSQYEEAKRQQIQKEPNLNVYKDQAYNVYINGLKDDNEYVLTKLRFTPENAIKELQRSAKEKDKILIKPEEKVESLYIKQNDPFLPHFIEDFQIDSKRYRSVVHYAYACLIENLLAINTVPDLEYFDVNTIALNNLAPTYHTLNQDWIYFTLKENNEIATFAKIYQNPVLAHLLKTLGTTEIIWNDKSDPVLGLGPDNRGANLVGMFLNYLKDKIEINQDNIPDPTISQYKDISANAWTKHWLSTISQELKNIIILIKNPSTKDLLMIIGDEENEIISSAIPSSNDIETMKSSGLTDTEIALTYPIVAYKYKLISSESESRLMQQLAYAFFSNADIPPKQQYNEIIESNLKMLYEIADKLELAENIDKKTFAISILANKPSNSIDDIRWDQLIKV